MRKLFTFFSLALVVLASCSKDSDDSSKGDSGDDVVNAMLVKSMKIHTVDTGIDLTETCTFSYDDEKHLYAISKESDNGGLAVIKSVIPTNEETIKKSIYDMFRFVVFGGGVLNEFDNGTITSRKSGKAPYGIKSLSSGHLRTISIDYFSGTPYFLCATFKSNNFYDINLNGNSEKIEGMNDILFENPIIKYRINDYEPGKGFTLNHTFDYTYNDDKTPSKIVITQTDISVTNVIEPTGRVVTLDIKYLEN